MFLEEKRTVYGPVKSWRFGSSLGIDTIFENSICSFNCSYCQLGKIQEVTCQRKVYVTTEKIIQDLLDFFEKKEKEQTKIDVITFSGSGEPTLAKNLQEIAQRIKQIRPMIPLIILTNSTTLLDPEVRRALDFFDRVILKLDALEERVFQIINQPAQEINLEEIKKGIKALRESYRGYLDFQLMFMPINISQADLIADFLGEIQPDFVYLNTPSRPVPIGSWELESRGNLEYYDPQKTRKLKTLDKEESLKVQAILKSKLKSKKTYLHCIYDS